MHSDIMAVSAQGAQGTSFLVSVQVFSLLDVLKGWVSEARAAATPSSSGDGAHAQLQHMSHLP